MSRRNAVKPSDPSLGTKKKPSNTRRVISETDPLNPILSEPFYNPYIEFNEREAMKRNKKRLKLRQEIKKNLNDDTLTDKQKRLEKDRLEEDNEKHMYKYWFKCGDDEKVDDIGESSSTTIVEKYDPDDDPDNEFAGLGMCNKYKSVKIHKLSPAQQRKLKKGNKVIIKGGSDHVIMLSPEQEKKFNKKSMMGCGITIQLDPYQQDMVMSGAGFKDFVGQMKKAKIGKKIIKFAKDNKILKRVGNALIDRAVATIAGSGVKKPRGRPRKGGALMPAGGGALKPAGNY